MIDDELRDQEYDEELNDWLFDVVSACVEHLKHVEEMEEKDPTSLSQDDYAVLELDRAMIVLYALHTKGDIPKFTEGEDIDVDKKKPNPNHH